MVEAPCHYTLPAIDEIKVPRIEIRDKLSRVVISVIELLSPTNKYSGEYRENYIRERTPMFYHGTKFVVIDLLRGGPKMPIPTMPDCTYNVLVRHLRVGSRLAYGPCSFAIPFRISRFRCASRSPKGWSSFRAARYAL